MMTFSTLLYTYLFGGVTFLPLVLLAILIPAWRALPIVEKSDKGPGNDDKGDKEERAKSVGDRDAKETEGVGASGTFAVLRKYDLQAALAALNRNHPPGSSGATGPDSHAEPSHGSESVYQSMYRSVFDRNKAASSNTSILENEDDELHSANSKTAKKTTPANVFYIVLRHGHLMLYDSTAEREVRHVISLAHYNISLSAGPAEPDERELKDGELFIRRTAIVLTPTSGKDSLWTEGRSQQSTQAKAIYLFSLTCIEKEDFYHALLSTRDMRPLPQPLETESVIKLQSMLHSTSALTPETRALNAVISRVFLGLNQTDRLKGLFRDKIEKKISRVQKPAFIASLEVHSIDLGDAAPILSNPRLKDFNIDGDMTVAFDIRYTGGIKFTFAALAKLDLGPRFKTRTADLLLSTSLQRLQGHVLIRIKPSPSNRLWFCFETIPDMDIKVEPVVSQRQITYTFILKAIEDRIRGVVGETLVQPNWDDIPFLDTRDRRWRGGVWVDGSGEHATPESPPSDLRKRHQKTMSMPSLGNIVTEGDSSGTSSGSETTSQAAALSSVRDSLSDLKRRSVNSLPLPSTPDKASQTSSRPVQKPVRTPTLTTPPASSPSVQLDENHANFDPAESGNDQSQQQRKWRILPSVPQQGSRRDAVESIRAMRDRAMAGQGTDEEQFAASDNEQGSFTAEPSEIDGHEGRVSSEIHAPSFAERSLRPVKRSDTNASTSTSSTMRSQRQQEAVQKGKTLFAATAAATNAATIAAKNWGGWSALANRTGKGAPGIAQGQQQAPVGRGQPLPPPGMPLPGPQKTWLPSGMGSVKRKPVLPARKGVTEIAIEADRRESDLSTASGPPRHGTGLDSASHVKKAATPQDEFGPWTENSGPQTGGDEHGTMDVDDGNGEAHVLEQHVEGLQLTDEPQTIVKRETPPPLPARRSSFAPEADLLSFEEKEQNVTIQTTGENEPLNDAAAHTGTNHVPDVIDDAQEVEITVEKPSEPTDLHMSDEDDLVAIPAPAEDGADEAQLEAEGVQQDSAAVNSTRHETSAEVKSAVYRSEAIDDDGEFRSDTRDDFEHESASR